MSLPSHISKSPNVAWLESLTALTPEDLRQRGNHSEFSDMEQRPLDIEASDALAQEIWKAIEEDPEPAVTLR